MPVEFSLALLMQAHDAVGSARQEQGHQFVGAVGPVGDEQVVFPEVSAQFVEPFRVVLPEAAEK